MEKRVAVGQRRRQWDSLDEEAMRQGDAIHAANGARATPSGKGKKVGKHRYRI